MQSIRHEEKHEYGIIEKAARSPEGFFAAFLAITEVLFSFVKFGFNLKYLGNKVFFAAVVGFFLGIIASLIPVKAARVISIISSVLFAIYLLVQLIYSSVFKNFWSFSATGGFAGQAFDFRSTILANVLKEIIPFLIILILYAFIIFCYIKWIDFSMHKWEMYMVNVAVLVAGVLYFIIMLSLQGNDKNSPINLIKNYSSIELSVQKLGVVETMLRDGGYMIFERDHTLEAGADTKFDVEDLAVTEAQDEITEPGDDKIADEYSGAETEKNNSEINPQSKDKNTTNINEADNEDEVSDGAKDEKEVYVPQKLDIDLNRMSSITSNSSVLEVTDYIKSVQPTFTNKYTGMFEGYNLIFITAEGFDGYVIDKTLTPELYKMSRQGFYFTNFYTPLWYGSTLGGEYANLTGMMPKSSGYLSMQKVGDQHNSMPFCLGNELKNEGYYVTAFHNNEYDYYERELSRPYIGYENYYGIGNGLECERDEYGTMLWPQSDLFMEQNTFRKYSSFSPFHVYYLTVSGHLNYNWGGNAMSEKNRDKVEHLYYSDTTKAYIACQLEFEYMVEALNKDLEKKGIADKTLIVICGDHVPYNDMQIVDELSGRTLDSFDKYRNSLIIYSASMTNSVRVDKPCYSPDILPTVLNLMGLEYDSRMMVGRDILSDDPGLVIMQDGSFITDNYRYDAMSGVISDNGRYDVSDIELDTKIALVANRFRLADAICELDYYSYIEQLKQKH